MRLLHILVISATLLAGGSRATALPATEENQPKQPVVADEKLRKVLLDRMERDQFIRKEVMKRKVDDAELAEMMKVDRDNTAWLKEVLDRHGWPGIALVGKDGAHAAWLLVQHADLDPAFQKRCLELLTVAVKKNDASAQDMAYLTDRVRVADKKLQVYGTQFSEVDGKLCPQPIEDEEHVDDRRKEVGLPPLREYLQQAEAFYSRKKGEPSSD